MASITEQTRTQLIGLSVAMLGQAPGTGRLNHWVADIDDDAMSVDDLANHIAESEAFQSKYPAFLTSEEFASAFLGSLLHGLDEASMMAAVELVSGMLDGGLSRGSLALAVVDALHDIAMKGMEHPAYDGLGMSAMAFANKVEVASYHTLTHLMADPSAEAIAGVTDDAATVETAKQHIDSPPADAMFDMVGELSLHENADGSGMPGDDNGPIGVGHVTASDSNGDMVTYSIAGDPDDWAILEDGKLCYTGTGVDYEMGSSIDLEIVATSTGADGTETSVSQMVTVMVGDVQESDAMFNDVGMLSIEENQAMGMVGSVTAMDAEDDPVTYRLADGSHAGFSIDEMTGAISYEGDGLDYETTPTVDLTVIATSTGANNMATDISQMVTVMVGDVDDLPDEPMTYVLTPTIDDFTGGDADDTFVAAPERGSNNLFSEVLNPFDSIDGGDGVDSIHISGVDPDQTLTLGAEDISNVENVLIRHVGAIAADMSDWEGLEMVDLGRFGRASDVTVEVNGAMVNSHQEFGGDVTIAGAGGALDIEASGDSSVHIGSAGQTESVMVKGGGNVMIGKNADGSGQSQTISSVSIDGVNPTASTMKMVDGFKAKVDTSGFLVDQAGLRQVGVEITDQGDPQTITSIKLGEELDGLRPLLDGGSDTLDPIQVVLAAEVDDTPADEEPLVFDTTTGQVRLQDGRALPSGIIVVFDPVAGPGKDATQTTVTTPGSGATVKVHSDAIADLTLASTTATVLVKNDSMTADKKPMPEDLSVTVDGFGNKDGAGKLCLDGKGAGDVMIEVAGDSNFSVASDAVKAVSVSGDGDLTLGITKFTANDEGGHDASGSLENLILSGAGDVTIDLNGLSKLASIDASASSGANKLTADGALESLASVMTGSGGDTVQVTATPKMESIGTGDGNDMVTVAGAHRKEGLAVDLGAGDDTYSGGAGDNSKSRVDGGDGMDTLMLSHGSGATYKPEGSKDSMSIYKNFEILDAGGSAGGNYDIKLLDVDSIKFSKTTTERANLKNVMTAGMGFSVMSGTAGKDVTAKVGYELFEAQGGSRFDAVDGGIFTIDVTANGGKKDTDANPKAVPAVLPNYNGEATVDLVLDGSIELMIVNSSASTGGTASAGGYENVICVTSSGIDAVKITGDSKLELKHGVDETEGLSMLRLVDATANTAGVTVTVGTDNDADAGNKLEMMGGSGDDTFNGGAGVDVLKGAGGKDTLNGMAGVDTLMGGDGDDTLDGGADDDAISGGAGADKLTGGTGDDQFQFASASDSQASINAVTGAASGHDVIMDWNDGNDTIGLTASLYDSISQRSIGMKEINNSDAQGEDDTDLTKDSLGALIGKGDGFFVAEDQTRFDNTPADTYSVVYAQEMNFTEDNSGNGVNDSTPDVTKTWVLIDVDGDGDFDASVDMVIELEGLAVINANSFAPIPVG